jgi:putative FmdB family regulatory protein
MPVYEYRCAACGRHFEKLRAISARDESVKCPSCGGRRAERLVSSFAAFAAEGGQTSGLGGCCGGGAGSGCACRG